MPTPEEIELHNATHIPFRSWCAFCVMGKAKADPHFKGEEERCSENVVSCDYAFLGKKGRQDGEDVEAPDEEVVEADSDADDESSEESTLKVLVLRDRRTKYVTASVVPRKGDHPYAVHRVGQDLANILGYKRTFLKSDQEPAIRKLKDAVRREYNLEIPDEYSPVGDSQSNGEVEISIQVVEGQVRTVKCQLANRLGQEVPVEHDILPWLVRHSGATISRYQKGRDGMTAYRRLKGREFQKAIVEFGECIWYLKTKDGSRGKLDPRWDTGVFLGVREESNEVVVGTNEGVIKCRTFRRKGSQEERWNRDTILGIKGVPWQPNPRVNTFDIRSRIVVPVEQPSEVEVGRMREFARRRWRIEASDLSTHGYTMGCPGCNAHRRGARAVRHSEICRARIGNALAEAGDPRIVRVVEEGLGHPVDPAELQPPEVAMREEEQERE